MQLQLNDILKILEQNNIDKTKSLYNYMDTNPINGTFESFCFDGKQFYKEFTNPDKPYDIYKVYYKTEKNFLVHWIRNRYVFYKDKDVNISLVFKDLLYSIKNN